MMAGGLDTKTTFKLKSRIQHEFMHYVDPNNVLSLFQLKKDSLTQADVSQIQAETNTKGVIIGASKLLDHLVRYKNWYEDMVDVLRNPSVKLSHVADIFDKIKGDLYTELLLETVESRRDENDNSYVRADSTTSLASQVYCGPATESEKMDDFSLDDDDCVSDDENTLDCDESMSEKFLTSDMPKPFFHEDDQFSLKTPLSSSTSTQAAIPNEDDERNLTEGVENLTLSSGQSGHSSQEMTDEEGYTEINEEVTTEQRAPTTFKSALMSATEDEDEHYDEVEYGQGASGGSASSSSSSGGRLQNPYGNTGALAQIPGGQSERKRSARYDFNFEETRTALSEFQGWHSEQSDKDVLNIFKKVLEKKEDGHYLIWYWQKKKRPAICVSHNGKLITFIIHRRPSKESPTKNIYFVDKRTPKGTLYDLYDYHLKNGLPMLKVNGPIDGIKLLKPIEYN